MTRKKISDSMVGDSPQSHDAITNSSTLAGKRRPRPKTRVSHPVSGTEIALATANEVMTHVPCDGLTPMSPAMAGIDTLAIDVSSTFMNVASDSATVPMMRALPSSGGNAGRGGPAGRAGAGAGAAAWVAASAVAGTELMTASPA